MIWCQNKGDSMSSYLFVSVWYLAWTRVHKFWTYILIFWYKKLNNSNKSHNDLKLIRALIVEQQVAENTGEKGFVPIR